MWAWASPASVQQALACDGVEAAFDNVGRGRIPGGAVMLVQVLDEFVQERRGAATGGYGALHRALSQRVP